MTFRDRISDTDIELIFSIAYDAVFQDHSSDVKYKKNSKTGK